MGVTSNKHLSVLPQIPKPTITIMSGNSSVGQSGVYEAGDQRNYKDSELKAAQEPNQGPSDDRETAASKKDPTLPAQLHGNEPSKGAKLDAELQAEDEQRLREKQGK